MSFVGCSSHLTSKPTRTVAAMKKTVLNSMMLESYLVLNDLGEMEMSVLNLVQLGIIVVKEPNVNKLALRRHYSTDYI